MSVNNAITARSPWACEALFNIDLGWALNKKIPNFARAFCLDEKITGGGNETKSTTFFPSKEF